MKYISYYCIAVLFVTVALEARRKVQQGQYGEKRNERERYPDGVGFFEPDVEE